MANDFLIRWTNTHIHYLLLQIIKQPNDIPVAPLLDAFSALIYENFSEEAWNDIISPLPDEATLYLNDLYLLTTQGKSNLTNITPPDGIDEDHGSYITKLVLQSSMSSLLHKFAVNLPDTTVIGRYQRLLLLDTLEKSYAAREESTYAMHKEQVVEALDLGINRIIHSRNISLYNCYEFVGAFINPKIPLAPLYYIIEEMGEQHTKLDEYFCPSLKRLASICKAGDYNPDRERNLPSLPQERVKEIGVTVITPVYQALKTLYERIPGKDDGSKGREALTNGFKDCLTHILETQIEKIKNPVFMAASSMVIGS